MEKYAFAPYDYLALVLLIIGIGLAISQFINLMFRLKFNTRAFNDYIIKFVQDGTLDRAIKLCDAAPSVLYARGMKSALLALQSGQTDPVALNHSFNEALQNQKMELPDSYTTTYSEPMQFPTLKGVLGKVRLKVYGALIFATAGAVLHVISFSEAPHEFFYGLAGAVLFFCILSLKETFGILRRTRTEFERFCQAVQGG